MRSDAYGSPEAVNWLQNLAPSQARDEWLAHARRAKKALLAGGQLDQAPPSEGRLVEAILADAAADRSTSMTSFSATLPPARFPPSEYLEQTNMFTLILTYLTGILAALLVGMLIQGFKPRWARWLRPLIPGSAKICGPFAVVICAAFMAALFAFGFDLDHLLGKVATPDSGRFFGMPESAHDMPSRWWAYVALLGSLAIHGITTWLEYHRRDRSKPMRTKD